MSPYKNVHALVVIHLKSRALVVTQLESHIVFPSARGVRQNVPDRTGHGQVLAVVRGGMGQDLRWPERLRKDVRSGHQEN